MLTIPAFSAGVTYNSDGSVSFKSSDGQVRRINMDGKTPYGITIKGERKVLRRRNFLIELIYDAPLSDDLLEGPVKTFYNELEKELQRWMHTNRLPRQLMKIQISNCRFGKTGFCRRENLKGLTLYIYRNNKRIREVHLDRSDILSTAKRPALLTSLVKKIMKK